MDIFKPRVPPVIGVDIAATSVKMVELSQVKGKIKLERYAIETLPADTISEGDVANSEALEEVLKKCHKKLGSRIKHIAAAMPSSVVVLRRVKMPLNGSQAAMDEQVAGEIGAHIPFPIEEASFDYQVISEGQGEEDSEIMVAAARRQLVDNRVTAFESAGLKPVYLDSEVLTQIAMIEHHMRERGENTDGKVFVVMDIGNQVTTFTFLQGEEVVYTREHGFGLEQLWMEIGDRLNISSDEAKRIQTGEEAPTEPIEDLITSFAEMAAQEIMRAKQLFITSTNFTDIDRILLTGRGATVDGVERMVADQMEVATEVFNPFDTMAVGASVDAGKLAKDAPALLVACGLALRRFEK